MMAEKSGNPYEDSYNNVTDVMPEPVKKAPTRKSGGRSARAGEGSRQTKSGTKADVPTVDADSVKPKVKTARTAQISILLTPGLADLVKKSAKTAGFKSVNAYIEAILANAHGYKEE